MAKYKLDNYIEVRFSAEGEKVAKGSFTSWGELFEVTPAGMYEEMVVGFMMEESTDSKVLIEGYIGLNAYWLAEIDSDYKNKGEDYLFDFIKEIINNYKAEIATAIAEVTEGSVTVDSIKNSFRVPQQKVKEI
jgi:hypothetical protein